ncbi:MAG: transglycosylase [Rhodocyclales bacterium]|nr:transglycosylase [Rhodocyclales bacterium]
MKRSQTSISSSLKALLICISMGFSGLVVAGGQQQEALAASVQTSMQKAISDAASPEPIFSSEEEKLRWLTEMSPRLAKRLPDTRDRVEFLKTVYYEAQRAGLDPQLVLGLIEVESAFRKYAVSSVGARGFMQVMPFWVKQIGTSEQNLFHLRTNLRYGCTILRHYLDIEKGDLYRALGRYNGSLGRPEYPNVVRAAWEKKWAYNKPAVQISLTAPTTLAQR